METSTPRRATRLLAGAAAACLALAGCTSTEEHPRSPGETASAATVTTTVPPVVASAGSASGGTVDLSALRPDPHEAGDTDQADFANAFADRSGSGPAQITLPARPGAKVGVTAACTGDGGIELSIHPRSGRRYLWARFDCNGGYAGSATSTKRMPAQGSTLTVKVDDGTEWRVLVGEAPSASPGAVAVSPSPTGVDPSEALKRLRALDGPGRAEFGGEGKPVRMILDSVSSHALAVPVRLNPKLNTGILVLCAHEALVDLSLRSADGGGITAGSTQCLTDGGSWTGGSIRSTRATLTVRPPAGTAFRVWVWQYRPAS